MAGFILVISTKGINYIQKGKLYEKKFMHTKRFDTFIKIWVQSCVGAILRVPFIAGCEFLSCVSNRPSKLLN